MPHFTHSGVSLFYKEAGEGIPFVFQHGLGADSTQPFGIFKPPTSVKLICMEARGHGSSELGLPEQISIATFADDLAALLHHLEIPTAIVGENLNRIPNDAPIRDLTALRSISVPTLILANKRDPIHPFEYGARLAEEIPGAEFGEIAPKSDDLQAHLGQTQNGIEEFLSEHFLKTAVVC